MLGKEVLFHEKAEENSCKGKECQNNRMEGQINVVLGCLGGGGLTCYGPGPVLAPRYLKIEIKNIYVGNFPPVKC